MKIEVGKTYKMRNGDVVGPIKEFGMVFSAPCSVDGFCPLWTEDGTEVFFAVGFPKHPQWDIVEEIG